MTYSGGPERSLAEPVTSESIDYPIVVNQSYPELEGDDIVIDDIVIEPGTRPSSAPPRRRMRAVAVAAIVAGLVAGGIAVAVANRDDSASILRSVSPAKPKPAAAKPIPNAIGPKPATVVRPRPLQPKPAIVTPTPPAVVVPPAVDPNVPVASPTIATPPPAPPVVTPPVESPSVLQWKATPATITVQGGGHKTFSVTVTNPTDGTVNLPQPLSCAPVLRGPKGVAFGFGVCVEMVQVMAPHQELSHSYTIYATDSATAGGNALKAGTYTATIDNLFTVKVHITAR